MSISTVLANAVLGIVFGAEAVFAAGVPGDVPGERDYRFALASAEALPPIGFVDFCKRNPDDCRGQVDRAMPVKMSREHWHAVDQVNSYVNGKIAPMSDRMLYGDAEYWAYPSHAGDCEDYVLMKKRYLEKLGFPRSSLLITVVLDERNEGHAVLTLRTDEGDFVLDNRRSDIRHWVELDYLFLKRQSEGDPRKWVSLGNGSTHDSAAFTSPPALLAAEHTAD